MHDYDHTLEPSLAQGIQKAMSKSTLAFTTGHKDSRIALCALLVLYIIGPYSRVAWGSNSLGPFCVHMQQACANAQAVGEVYAPGACEVIEVRQGPQAFCDAVFSTLLRIAASSKSVLYRCLNRYYG